MYSVQLDIYPYNLTDSQDELNFSKGNILKLFKDWDVVLNRDGIFKNYNSFDILLKKQENFIKYRGFHVNNFSYTIISSSTNGDFPKFEDFANSFQLINTNPTIK